MLQCPKVAVIIIDFTNKNRKPDIYRPSGEEVTAEAIKNIIQAVKNRLLKMVYYFPLGQIFISSQQLKYFQEIYRRSALNNVASSGNLLLLQNWTFTFSNIKSTKESLKLMKAPKVLCPESFHVEQQTDNVTELWYQKLKLIIVKSLWTFIP